MQNNIKKIRKKEKKSQKELAHYLKVSQQTISYMETHDVVVAPERMKKIAKFLDRTIPEVFPYVKQLQ